MEASEVEADILQRSTKRTKRNQSDPRLNPTEANDKVEVKEEKRRSYRDSVMGEGNHNESAARESDNDGGVSDDDVIEEGDDETWFGIEMIREEKITARRPWRKSLIIKLVGRSKGITIYENGSRKCRGRRLSHYSLT